ncbi:hypothetical protein ACFU8W_41425 [Streptomyces sp. NPDC057565]|uniref:hypothetical protein n=1 Tax=Streptomyces sp. NPDC057565 TaxID=3346169 RepID=UPI0036C6387F
MRAPDLTDVSTANDKAWVMLSHGFPLLERMRLQVLDARGRVVAPASQHRAGQRSCGAPWGADYYV